MILHLCHQLDQAFAVLFFNLHRSPVHLLNIGNPVDVEEDLQFQLVHLHFVVQEHVNHFGGSGFKCLLKAGVADLHSVSVPQVIPWNVLHASSHPHDAKQVQVNFD